MTPKILSNVSIARPFTAKGKWSLWNSSNWERAIRAVCTQETSRGSLILRKAEHAPAHTHKKPASLLWETESQAELGIPVVFSYFILAKLHDVRIGAAWASASIRRQTSRGVPLPLPDGWVVLCLRLCTSQMVERKDMGGGFASKEDKLTWVRSSHLESKASAMRKTIVAKATLSIFIPLLLPHVQDLSFKWSLCSPTCSSRCPTRTARGWSPYSTPKGGAGCSSLRCFHFPVCN